MATVAKHASYGVSPTRPEISIIVPYIALVDIDVGEMVKTGAGGVTLSVTGDTEGEGMALSTVKAGDAVDVLMFGPVEGFDLSSQSVGDLIYAYNNGLLDDANTSALYTCGAVKPSQVSPTGKVLWVNCLAAQVGA